MSSLFPAGAGPAPGSAHERYVEARLEGMGRWGTETVADAVGRHGAEQPEGVAFVEGARRMTWAEYDERSDRLAAALLGARFERGERVGVLLPDGPDVHVAFVAAEKAGLVVVGIGPRAGQQEISHLLGVTGATALVTAPTAHQGSPPDAVVDHQGPRRIRHLVLEGDTITLDGSQLAIPSRSAAVDQMRERRLRPNEIFLVNSTSGTTGMPKCVVHTQDRWLYFHQLAVEAGALSPSDVFVSLIPAPFGFGIWTSHVTPALLGCPTAVMARFSPEGALGLIEQEGATVLSCVSTQFIMMLNAGALEERDLTSLRAMFTGGEAVPYERSAEFEDRTGAKVLQFYGSNETGALSRTTVHDDREHRLTTAGRVIEGMDVRLYDDDGRDVTATGGPGQAACSGPATCLGYYADPGANQALVNEAGSMLTGDIVEIDGDGYLRVVGRKSDFIIRGGKNISALAVEEAAGTHPAVALVAAVSMPDAVFGERVCAYVTLHEGQSLSLEELGQHMVAQGTSKELLPERLEILDELPRASGGKVAKGELRADIRRRLTEGGA